jgi:hypothetical protein
MPFWPTSHVGRWSVGALATFALGLTGLFTAAALGQEGGETFSDNWWLAGPGLVAVVAALATFVTSIIALIRWRERAISVIVALAVSSMAIIFMLGEVIVPH